MRVRSKNNLFDPTSCSYKLSGKIRKHVEKLIHSNAVEEDVRSILAGIMEEDEAEKNTLSYDSLVKLHKYVQRADPDYIDPFYMFSEACKCIEPKQRENKNLDTRLKALRLKSSQTMYNSMAASVDPVIERNIDEMADRNIRRDLFSEVYYNVNNTESGTQLSEYKKLYGSAVAVINSFLVFICTFLFCYKALEYALPEPHIASQVLFGLGGSTVVAIAELYFLLRVV